MEKMFFPTTVGPVGDLLIPGVGPVSISGVNLKNSIQLIKDRISKTYNNADIGVSLIDLKTFKIQIYGAVINPGFAEIQATTRLDAAIEKLGGLHRYADEENISIISSKGAIAIISLKAYLIDGNLDNNPQLYEGDKINLPYLPSHINEFKTNVTFKRVPVLVTGFVNHPGPINYFPGYSVKDYIGLAGGVSELGNVKKVYLIRDDIKSKINNNEVVIPGDHIIVPEGTFSVLFGKNSFLQNLTALFSIISTYTIISDRLGN
jgi:protein involved in polysaccharide export with SLBB domain